MSNTDKAKLGDYIFNTIDNNDFLNVLYDNLLYNYAIMKLHLEGFQQARQVDVNAALRFADLLSKSTHPVKADDHKMWAQTIITLLLELYPEDEDVAYYARWAINRLVTLRRHPWANLLLWRCSSKIKFSRGKSIILHV